MKGTRGRGYQFRSDESRAAHAENSRRLSADPSVRARRLAGYRACAWILPPMTDAQRRVYRKLTSDCGLTRKDALAVIFPGGVPK